jgi:hypothetical protein
MHMCEKGEIGASACTFIGRGGERRTGSQGGEAIDGYAAGPVLMVFKEGRRSHRG